MLWKTYRNDQTVASLLRIENRWSLTLSFLERSGGSCSLTYSTFSIAPLAIPIRAALHWHRQSTELLQPLGQKLQPVAGGILTWPEGGPLVTRMDQQVDPSSQQNAQVADRSLQLNGLRVCPKSWRRHNCLWLTSFGATNSRCAGTLFGQSLSASRLLVGVRNPTTFGGFDRPRDERLRALNFPLESQPQTVTLTWRSSTDDHHTKAGGDCRCGHASNFHDQSDVLAPAQSVTVSSLAGRFLFCPEHGVSLRLWFFDSFDPFLCQKSIIATEANASSFAGSHADPSCTRPNESTRTIRTNRDSLD